MDAQPERESPGLCDGFVSAIRVLAKHFGLRKELDITEIAILIVFFLSFGLALGLYLVLVMHMITYSTGRENFIFITLLIVCLSALIVVFIQTLDLPNQDNYHTSKAEQDCEGDMCDTVQSLKDNHVAKEKMEGRYYVALDENQRLEMENVKYVEDRKVWGQEKSNLIAELDAVRKCAQLYRSVLHDIDRF